MFSTTQYICSNITNNPGSGSLYISDIIPTTNLLLLMPANSNDISVQQLAFYNALTLKGALNFSPALQNLATVSTTIKKVGTGSLSIQNTTSQQTNGNTFTWSGATQNLVSQTLNSAFCNTPIIAISSSNVSISFWMYMTSNCNPTGYNPVFSIWSSPYPSGQGFTMTVQSLNSVQTNYASVKWFSLNMSGSSSNFSYSASTNLSTGGLIGFNTWYHIVLLQSSSNWLFYVNNVLVQTITGMGVLSNGNYNLYLGCGITGNAFPNAPFDGYIDDLRVHNRIITAAEITTLYNAV